MYFTTYTVLITGANIENKEKLRNEIAILYESKLELGINLDGYRRDPIYCDMLDYLFAGIIPIDYKAMTEATKEISLLYPDIYFTIISIGEHWDDRYVIYCKNGKSELCLASIVVETPKNLDIVDNVISHF